MRSFITAAFLAATAAAATADFQFTIDPGASAVLGSFTLSADTEGTLIGDYDPDTNPGGTQTRPGLFGGSGNNPIPVSIDTASSTDLDLSPAGGFALDADTDALTFTIAGLVTDLLNGQSAESTLGLVLFYSTFRTINPDSLYPGGIPLPIEFGAAEFTTLVIEQTGPMTSPGVLVPAGDNEYTLAGVLPAQLLIAGDALGSPIEPEPLPVALPLSGTLTLDPAGGATITLELALDGISQDFDATELPPLPDFPFPLPTLTGEEAGVILSLSVTRIGVEGEGDVVLNATADAAGCNPADLAEPFGVLDLADLSAFIAAFVAQDPLADLTGDGVYDLADIQVFVNAFLAGCP